MRNFSKSKSRVLIINKCLKFGLFLEHNSTSSLKTGLQNKYFQTVDLTQNREHESRSTYCGAFLKDRSGKRSSTQILGSALLTQGGSGVAELIPAGKNSSSFPRNMSCGFLMPNKANQLRNVRTVRLQTSGVQLEIYHFLSSGRSHT